MRSWKAGMAVVVLALELSQYCTRLGSEMPCVSIDGSDLDQINIPLSLALAMSNGARIDSWPAGPGTICTVPCHKLEFDRFVGSDELLVSYGERMSRCRRVNIYISFCPLLIPGVRRQERADKRLHSVLRTSLWPCSTFVAVFDVCTP